MRVELSSRLLRRGIARPRDALRLTAYDEAELSWYAHRGGRFVAVEPEATDDDDVVLVVRTAAKKPQAWQVLLRDVLKVPGFDVIAGNSMGAALLVRLRDRSSQFVAYTFGGAHHLIDQHAVDPRFGLLAVLNRMAATRIDDSSSLRSQRHGITGASVDTRSGPLQRATLDARIATRASQLSRVDTLSDLLTRVRAIDNAAGLGRLEGGRLLKQNRDVRSLDDLVALAHDDVALSEQEGYRREHGWIDRIAPVHDDDERTAALCELWRRIWEDVAPQPEILWHALPDEDERPIDYWLLERVQNTRTVAKNKTMTWPAVRKLLLRGASGPDDPGPLQTRVRFFDHGREEVASSSVLELLAYEWRFDDALYVLSEGDVFRVDADLVANVNEDVEQWVRTSRLPPYRGQQEGVYNTAAVDASGWRGHAVALDGHCVRLPGQTPIEPCDILTDRGEFIHVKRKARSSTLSHLWEQAFVSAQLLRRHEEARMQVCGYVLDLCEDEDLIERLWERIEALAHPGHGSTAVFALIGSWQRAHPSSLPFFSRIALRDACMRLHDLGFTPAVEFVSGP